MKRSTKHVALDVHQATGARFTSPLSMRCPSGCGGAGCGASIMAVPSGLSVAS